MTVLKILKLQEFVSRSCKRDWKAKVVFPYKCFQLSAAIAITTFEAHGWKLSVYLILIAALSACANKFFKNELFLCLLKNVRLKLRNSQNRK